MLKGPVLIFSVLHQSVLQNRSERRAYNIFQQKNVEERYRSNKCYEICFLFLENLWLYPKWLIFLNLTIISFEPVQLFFKLFMPQMPKLGFVVTDWINITRLTITWFNQEMKNWENKHGSYWHWPFNLKKIELLIFDYSNLAEYFILFVSSFKNKFHKFSLSLKRNLEHSWDENGLVHFTSSTCLSILGSV